MIFYLKEKKRSNESFHIDGNLKAYVRSHESDSTYNVNEFLATVDMHLLDGQDAIPLQPVFEKVCRILNKQSD